MAKSSGFCGKKSITKLRMHTGILLLFAYALPYHHPSWSNRYFARKQLISICLWKKRGQEPLWIVSLTITEVSLQISFTFVSYIYATRIYTSTIVWLIDNVRISYSHFFCASTKWKRHRFFNWVGWLAVMTIQVRQR